MTTAPRVIDARITRKLANSLCLTFTEGESDPLAVATQGSADARGAKLGILFGFKNGGPGRHGLVYPDVGRHVVESRPLQSTLITDSDGAAVARVDRVGEGRDRSTAVTASGHEILHFDSDPDEPITADVFRIVITDAMGADLGRLHVIRNNNGWKSLSNVLDSAYSTYVWWGQAGQSLPLNVIGTRLILLREVTPEESKVLFAACVDLAIGMRPYIKEMN